MDINDLKDMTSKEIANNLEHVVDGRTSVNIIAKAHLQAALNKELIDSQKEYQDKSIGQMKNLVYATWILAVATIIAAFAAQL